MTSTSAVRAAYTERLLPHAAGWLIAPGAGLMTGLAVTPLGVPLAVIVGGVTAVIVAAVLTTSSPAIRVVGGEVSAGRATIPALLLGGIDQLDRVQTREAMSTGLDLRAWVCHRSWVATSLRLQVVDPQDPTPYWLVSTRHPEQLTAAITAAREASRSPASR